MPVVPTYDNLRTSVAPMPGPQVDPMDGPARQSAQFGEAVGRAGGSCSRSCWTSSSGPTRPALPMP